MRRTYLFASILFVAAMLLLTLPTAERSVRAQKQTDGHFQYAVKFVCGRSQPNPTQQQVVATGTYFTAINVHNPWSFDKPVEFRKKFAIALPGEKAGDVSPFFQTQLGSDKAFEIDCGDILKHLHSTAPFVKGFAVIESPVELDIVAVYTAAGSTQQIETMELERVPARRMP